jgi:hypothetical protein
MYERQRPYSLKLRGDVDSGTCKEVCRGVSERRQLPVGCDNQRTSESYPVVYLDTDIGPPT